MTKVTLVHPSEAAQLLGRLLVLKCDLFANNMELTISPYTLKSQVSLSDFRDFVSALEGIDINITNHNFKGLSQLCDEFGFRDLTAPLSQFRESEDFKKETTNKDLDVCVRLLALEERMQQHDLEIAAVQCELSRQSRVQESTAEAFLGRIARLETDVSTL
jgi:hypothetical protein